MIAFQSLPQGSPEAERLNGTWGLVRAEQNERRFPASGILAFGHDGRYVMVWNMTYIERGVDLLTPTTTPKRIDVVIDLSQNLATGGPGRPETRMTGIYKLEDDTFTACYGRGFIVRPNRFSSNNGYLFVWRRLPLDIHGWLHTSVSHDQGCEVNASRISVPRTLHVSATMHPERFTQLHCRGNRSVECRTKRRNYRT